ncbi:hypothetical protein [Streptomyces sp. NPDC059018]|uniref:hypothetical protein n=1 Tax=Streptomyces sp. NPDC059018 TaxID=3346701 RepID=UPI00369119EF
MPIRVPRIRLTGRTVAATAPAAPTPVLVPRSDAHGTAAREGRTLCRCDGATRECAHVDIRRDGDGGGRNDRLAVGVVRPREPAQHGRKIPVAVDAGPYCSCCGRGNESERRTHGVPGHPVAFPLLRVDCFVPRGCALVASTSPVAAAPTAASEARSGPQSAEAVVDRLDSRPRAFTARTGPRRAAAPRTTTGVGMIGRSRDGTVTGGTRPWPTSNAPRALVHRVASGPRRPARPSELSASDRPVPGGSN